MHPAKSVILFTVLSGLGYGLLTMLYLHWLYIGEKPDFYLLIGFIALALVSVGLMSSLFHLGRPERAWRALSQWKSSWLSREGVLSILSFIPALASVVMDHVAVAMVGVILNMLTVFATAMIYASLKPVPAWYHFMVPINYMIMSIVGGKALYMALGKYVSNGFVPFMPLAFAVVIMLVGKVIYWCSKGMREKAFSVGSATGLGKFGTVRLIDPPHDGSNYLMKEMIFTVARSHVNNVKISIILLWLMATVYSLIGYYYINLIVVFLFLGLLLERWLFFAEAKHVVRHYY